MTAKAGSVEPRSSALASFEQDYINYRRKSRREWLLWTTVMVVLLTVTAYLSDFFKVTQISLADGSRVEAWVLLAGLPRLGEFLSQMVPTIRVESFFADIAEWFWGIDIWMKLIVETLLIAFLATLLGVTAGFLISFPAARNLSPHPALTFFCRRFAEFARTVPELVWALIFVFSFGIGPMAGVLAIAVHTMGALGKLYSEVNENIRMQPLDGIKASGGTWFDTIRYGAVPQVLPNIMSYTLLRFEINVRSSSIIGYVGAGGLGQEFRTAMSYQEYTDVAALFVLTLAMVAIIDLVSERIRHRFIGMEASNELVALKNG